jgi:hypothetical protein
MAGFAALSVRDLVALVVIAARTIGERDGVGEPDKLTDEAFAVADAFVHRSEGRWANGARANHRSKTEERSREEP